MLPNRQYNPLGSIPITSAHEFRTEGVDLSRIESLIDMLHPIDELFVIAKHRSRS